MRYLLVGNGPTTDRLHKLAFHADTIIQFNDCLHADRLPHRPNYIFITNTGSTAAGVIDRLSARRSQIARAKLVVSRNPLYYGLKKRLLSEARRKDFDAHGDWKRLADVWPVLRMSLLSGLRLDKKLVGIGMPPSFMPSTGLIAYDWVSRRLRAGDSIDIEGFTFEGWDWHPWAIEKSIVKPCALPYPWQAPGFWGASATRLS